MEASGIDFPSPYAVKSGASSFASFSVGCFSLVSVGSDVDAVADSEDDAEASLGSVDVFSSVFRSSWA
jgi:hypothetical protein